jgi:hypothetical protein
MRLNAELGLKKKCLFTITGIAVSMIDKFRSIKATPVRTRQTTTIKEKRPFPSQG